jgi:uncharacterized protein (TIGR00661 family)
MLKFKPDVVITDFEPVSCYAALLLNKKCISIDNQHIINTKLNIKTNPIKQFVLWLVIKSVIPKANHRLVTTFFYPPVHKKRTHLFPTINRKEILDAKSKKGSHILVYQTSKSNKKLLPSLRQLPHSFVVYGFDKEKTIGNVHFRKFDEKGFIKDLSTSKAVITNGGFTVIGEALHLQKPILSVPVKRQVEQIINAVYLERMGYGKCYKHTNKRNIQEFLSNLNQYQKNVKKYKPQDNSKIIAHLNQILQKIYK